MSAAQLALVEGSAPQAERMRARTRHGDGRDAG
jgi:hypothetical protein